MNVYASATATIVVAAAAAACVPSLQVPTVLEPADASLALVAPARGVQIYECRVVRGQEDQYSWVFVAPEAKLYDRNGRIIGTHAAGPTWQASDGSKVVGKLVARVDAPTADSIPWLLLSARSEGEGSFQGVTAIQRVNTLGGIAPSRPCNAQMLGQQTGVHYTADYRFYIARH